MDPAAPAGTGRAPSGTKAVDAAAPPAAAGRLLAWGHVDVAPDHRQPAWWCAALATAVSLAGSLGADVLSVHIGAAVFPATVHFSHFRTSEYASLTVVGVLAACAAWLAVTRISSAPRPLFLRLAVAATLALWLPDLWLLITGNTPAGVGVLMVMHLLIAAVTYNALVRLAPVRPAPARPTPATQRPGPGDGAMLGEEAVRKLWSTMAALVALELVLGVATIVTVPFRRPDALLPARATWLYAAHGAVGIALGIGAVGVLVLSTAAGRMARIGAVLGAVGVVVGVVGGVLATFQVTRLLGMGVMMLGVVAAGVGYLVPALEAMGKAEAAKAEAARAEVARAEAARAEGTRAEATRAAGGGPNGHAPAGPQPD